MSGAIYDVSESDGIIINKRTGRRAFLLGAEPWTDLTDQLSQIFGFGAQVILFRIGRSFGLSMALEEKKVKTEEEITVNSLTGLATLAGWGKLTMLGDSTQNLRIIAKNCVFCAAAKNPKEREISCFFLRGIISGFAEAVRGPSQIEEAHCDPDYCEFTVAFSEN